ncbi:hypothetical protein ANCDUO_14391, partial [Ancylostoma duodenale]
MILFNYYPCARTTYQGTASRLLFLALVHVSTAYANCDRAETEEKVYEPPVAPQKLLEAIRWMDNDMIALITPKLLGNRPNTYTLTKALAE